MPLEVWILKSCDTCRRALAWLDQLGVAYEARDVREDGLDRDTIVRIVSAVGVDRAVNRRSATWRDLPDAAKADLDTAAAVALIEQHDVNVWLVNTGWTGGAYGEGQRMKLAYTRAMVDAALDRELDDVPMTTNEVFGLGIPSHCPGVPSSVLEPRNTWSDGEAYDKQAKALAQMFKDNFKQFEANVSEEVVAAGPK